MNTHIILEALDLSTLTEADLDAESRTVRQRIIASGRSKNGRVYSEDVLARAAPLFEGCKTFADHPGKQDIRNRPERSVEHITGWLQGVECREGALYATRHFTSNERGRDIYKLVEDVVLRNAPATLLGGSINALGTGTKDEDSGDLIVESIERVLSVDDVTNPAAGGGFMPLAASSGDELMTAVLEALTYEEWFESRPDYRKRLQNEMKTIRQTDAVKAATAEADQQRTALQEAQQQNEGLTEELAKLRTEHETVRRELLIERALKGVKLPATWAESLRRRLVEAEPDNWTAIINDEVTKAKQVNAQHQVTVTGAGYREAAPLPPADPLMDIRPRDNENAETWWQRVSQSK
jgi:hypothetical protein